MSAATAGPRPGVVTLRPVVPTDLPLIFEQQRDPLAAAMAGLPPRDRDAFDAHWRRLATEPGIVTRAVLLDGAVVGHALSWEKDGRRLVGYWVDRAHWGKGVATRALAALLAELPMRPLHATVSPGNAASIRALARAGFVEAPGGRAADAHGEVLAFVLER